MCDPPRPVAVAAPLASRRGTTATRAGNGQQAGSTTPAALDDRRQPERNDEADDHRRQGRHDLDHRLDPLLEAGEVKWLT